MTDDASRIDWLLVRRFSDHLEEMGWLAPDDRVVVACSGGLDSTVLLHLLRFGAEEARIPPFELFAAHFDHRMRPESADDAARVAELASSWGIEVEIGRAEREIASETEGRKLRYRFLEEVRSRLDARWVVTAHHADDQAETILFRVLRGTGLRGLAGIPEQREPSILRPLLPFTRAELEEYATRVGIHGLPDETNRDPRFARNVIRHEILPRAESAVAPGARQALLRLGRIARESEEGWESLLPELTARIVLEETAHRLVFAREPFLQLHPAVRARVLRSFLSHFDARLDAAGTRAALEFTRIGTSGHEWWLPGEVVLVREFDRFVLSAEGTAHVEGIDPAGQPLRLEGPGPGKGTFGVGGRRFVARWGPQVHPDASWVEPFPPSRLRFPLFLRGWLPGDRMQLTAGSRKLKKVLAEARIPVRERARLPVLVDAEGEALWVPGVAKAVLTRGRGGPEGEFAEPPLFIGIEETTDAREG